MNLQLTDQVIFIAGSSRGIGREIAAVCLAEGARVVITGRDEGILSRAREEITTPENHQQLLAISGDFTDPATIEDAFNLTIGRFGQIDHLVSNLGASSGKSGWDQPEEEWTRLFDVNFFASVRLAQAAIPHLRGRAGSILFLSSISAAEVTSAPLPYSAAKAALNIYAKNLSHLLAPEQIRVNTIAPGNILFPGGALERHLHLRQEAVEHMLATEIPMQRFGTPQEVASLAAFLCSPHAAFCTGGNYTVDGGQTRST